MKHSIYSGKAANATERACGSQTKGNGVPAARTAKAAATQSDAQPDGYSAAEAAG